LSQVLSTDQDHANLSPQTSLFLDHLDYASSVNVSKETSADDFLRELLDIAGYEEYGLYLRCQSIPFNIYGGQKNVQALLIGQALSNSSPCAASLPAR